MFFQLADMFIGFAFEFRDRIKTFRTRDSDDNTTAKNESAGLPGEPIQHDEKR